MKDHLLNAVEAVVANDNCSGCGACALVSSRIAVSLDDSGFVRPKFMAGPGAESSAREAREFRRVCPGVQVRAPRDARPRHSEVFGAYFSAWAGWAKAPDIRHAGSSAGVLTALSDWLVSTGKVSAVQASGVRSENPTRTVPVQIMSREDALAAAGSRYAPVSNLGSVDFANVGALVGKPCEISAARQLDSNTEHNPIYLSFFCAGTPSQAATDRLIESLNVVPEDVKRLAYRGDGWPGLFKVENSNGEERSVTYEQSWGEHLGRDLQWRCKVCVDGTGGAADIAVGDYWATDDSGYPRFDNAEGTSVVIARTARGAELLEKAVRDGVLELSPLDLEKVEQVQPLQVSRRTTLFGRLVGTRLAGRQIPRYTGYGLFISALKRPLSNAGAARWSFGRVRSYKSRRTSVDR